MLCLSSTYTVLQPTSHLSEVPSHQVQCSQQAYDLAVALGLRTDNLLRFSLTYTAEGIRCDAEYLIDHAEGVSVNQLMGKRYEVVERRT